MGFSKEKIENFIVLKDKEAIIFMEIAIRNYEDLLEYGGKELNERTES